MKNVMISINPKWCELIVSGEKTVEIRKNRPKIETPFKCYIYQTVDARINTVDMLENNLGKVIGEFVCDNIYSIQYRIPDNPNCLFSETVSCLKREDFIAYGKGKPLYGWHISDLKIYDKPKELGNFWKADKCPYATESGCTYKYHCFRAGQTQRCGETLTRPPQSWCYCEVEDDE